MNDRNRRRIERLSTSSSYVQTNAADFPAGSKGAQALAALNAAIADAHSHDATRATGQRTHQQATSSRVSLRTALRRQVAAISNTAETIGFDFPEIKDSFHRPSKNLSDQTLLGTSRSFAAAALPLFLEELNAGIVLLESAIENQNNGASARQVANGAFEAALERGEIELEKLDTAVRNKYRDNPAKLAAWETARHLERAPKKKKDADKPAPTTPKE